MFRRRGKTNLLPNYIIMLLLVLFALGPIAILIFNSLKSNLEVGKNPIGIPKELVLSNYLDAWLQGGFSTT